jgi:hypothetical protein
MISQAVPRIIQFGGAWGSIVDSLSRPSSSARLEFGVIVVG